MEFFLNNLIIKVGDGSRVKFWKDKWCVNVCLEKEFPVLFRLVVDKEASFRSMYEKKDGSSNWIFNFQRRLFD